jgi:hypothetical protein
LKIIAKVTFEEVKHLTINIKNCVSHPNLDLIGSESGSRQTKTTHKKVKKFYSSFEGLDVLFEAGVFFVVRKSFMKA